MKAGNKVRTKKPVPMIEFPKLYFTEDEYLTVVDVYDDGTVLCKSEHLNTHGLFMESDLVHCDSWVDTIIKSAFLGMFLGLTTRLIYELIKLWA